MKINIGKKYYTDIVDYNIYNNINNYKGPVLIFHGDKDRIVPYLFSMKAEEVYDNCVLRIIKDENHGFENETENMVGDVVCEKIKGIDELKNLVEKIFK